MPEQEVKPEINDSDEENVKVEIPELVFQYDVDPFA